MKLKLDVYVNGVLVYTVYGYMNETEEELRKRIQTVITVSSGFYTSPSVKGY